MTFVDLDWARSSRLKWLALIETSSPAVIAFVLKFGGSFLLLGGELSVYFFAVACFGAVVFLIETFHLRTSKLMRQVYFVSSLFLGLFFGVLASAWLVIGILSNGYFANFQPIEIAWLLIFPVVLAGGLLNVYLFNRAGRPHIDSSR